MRRFEPADAGPAARPRPEDVFAPWHDDDDLVLDHRTDVDALVELGLVEESLRGAADALFRSERIGRFDSEAGVYPVPHAELARTLAALTPRALGIEAFSQEVSDPDGPSFAQYTLIARTSERAWKTT